MKKYPKYLKKLIIFGLVLVLLPIIALGAFSSFIVSDILKNKVVDSNMQIMTQTKMRIEQTLKTVDSTIVPFLNSNLLGKAINESYTSYDFEIYDEISRNLYSLQSNDLPFYNVHLVNLKMGWIINMNGLFQLSDFQNKDVISKYATYESSSFWVREDKNTKSTINIQGYTPIDGITIVKKIPINTMTPTGLIIIQIRQSELDKFIVKGNSLGEVMLVDASNYIVHSDNGSMRGKDISFLPYMQKIHGSEKTQGFFETPIDGDIKVVTYSKSQYNNWVYLSIVSKQAVLKEARSLFYINLLICLFILLLFGILSVFMSRIVYKPIGKIYDFIKNDKKDNGANDELKFIGDSLNTLVADNSQMADQLQGRMQQVKEFFVIKLLQSQISQKDISAKLSIFPHAVPWKFMSVLTINIFDFEVNSYEIKDRDLILFAISNVVSDLVPQEHQLCPVIIEDFVSVLVGGNYELADVFKEYISKTAVTIQENLANHLGIRVDIGVSRVFENMAFSYKAFGESKEALKYRFRAKQEVILFFDDITEEPPAVNDLSKNIDDAITEAIKFGDKPQAELLLHEYVEKITNSKTSVNRYQVLLIRLIIDIVSILPNEEKAPIDEYINGKTFIENINELKHAEQIEEWIITNIITPVYDKVSGYRASENKKISTKIIAMIENEYDQDLDLIVCGERLHYHPNYIRRAFAEETGTTFSEYLLNYRIKIAKKWLVETDMKISDIAEKLRYNNPQNFIRSFRKKEGLTPGEYRSSHCKFL